eukprot:545207-Alexandrium_andersonii.AAC.1
MVASNGFEGRELPANKSLQRDRNHLRTRRAWAGAANSIANRQPQEVANAPFPRGQGAEQSTTFSNNAQLRGVLPH